MQRKIGAALAGFVLFISLASASYADILRYTLDDHPDGNAREPVYGLRLDGLLSGNAGDIYTFSFDKTRSGVEMFLDYDTAAHTVRIHGSAYGGEDTGRDWAAGSRGLVNIDFTYRVKVSASGNLNDLDIEVLDDDPANAGAITLISGFGASDGAVIGLWDFTMGGSAFYFNDTDDHRYAGAPDDVFIGWGWLNHTDPGTHLVASDWLFTATPVPLPGAIVLLGSGLMGVVGIRRKYGKR